MKTHWSPLLIVIVLLTVLPSRTAHGASQGVPVSVYPADAHVSYRAHVSNHQLDCMWSFFCEGVVPLFHFQTQDQLHRIDGWAQFARWKTGPVTMASELFVSRYAPGDDGQAPAVNAYLDLLTALHVKGYRRVIPGPSLLPKDVQGAWTTEEEHTSRYTLTVMACAAGSVEVEAIVMVDGGNEWARGQAVEDLARSVRAACAITRTT